jgi:hypothetical protein
MPSCSECCKSLESNQEQVTTESGITFHRSCLEQVLHGKPKSTNQVCEENFTTFDTLLRNKTKLRCTGKAFFAFHFHN